MNANSTNTTDITVEPNRNVNIEKIRSINKKKRTTPMNPTAL